MHFKIAAEDKTNHRYSGVLAHPTSFPSPYGVGDMGKEAYNFIDFLHMAGQHLWQVLPLGPCGNGNSPYQSFSVFAGQPLLISPDLLIEKKLLTREDLEPIPEFNPDKVEYTKVTEYKTGLFRKAYQNFRHTSDKDLLEEYDSFQKNNEFWLEDYCLYMAGKDYHENLPWYEWEDSLLDPTPAERTAWLKLLETEVDYYCFVQFCFFSQWYALKDYANEKGIAIIGDIPIFTSPDSADVWANKSMFCLDTKGHPLEVAGVPPDYFAAEGQLWGNPLYDWKAHKKDSYRWWIERVRHQLDQVDYVRIDHFRGFDEYYSIPFGDQTAERGHWEKGPGMDLFNTVKEKLGDVDVIAEDLGYLTESVIEMVKESGYPGMKVLQFAFDSREESDYLPHNYERNCVVYTGTHDNDTILGWYYVMSEEDREFSKEYMGNAKSTDEELPWDFIRMSMESVANLAVTPMQEFLGLGTEARINYPSTLGNNWKWRLLPGQFTPELAKRIYRLTQITARIVK